MSDSAAALKAYRDSLGDHVPSGNEIWDAAWAACLASLREKGKPKAQVIRGASQAVLDKDTGQVFNKPKGSTVLVHLGGVSVEMDYLAAIEAGLA